MFCFFKCSQLKLIYNDIIAIYIVLYYHIQTKEAFMNILESNLFTLDKEENKTLSINKLLEMETPKIEEHTLVLREDKKQTVTEKVQSRSNGVLGCCKGYGNIAFDEIELNSSNFPKYHYSLMGKHLVIVMGNKTETKYLVEGGQVFIVTDQKLIKRINSMPSPHKITLDYTDTYNNNSILSFKILTKVLFGIEEDNMSELIKMYLKPSVVPYMNVSSEEEYKLNYYLFNIFPRIEHLISATYTWRYFYIENEIYNIQKKLDFDNTIDKDIIEKTKEKHISELNTLINDYKIEIEPNLTKKEIYTRLKSKVNGYMTLNSFILNYINHDYLAALSYLTNEIQFTKNVLSQNTLFTQGTYNDDALIENTCELSFNPIKNKILIKGSYTDLYFKAMASLLFNRKLSSIAEKPIIEELLENNVDNALYIPHTEIYIKALLDGYSEEKEIYSYFEDNYYTQITEDIYNKIKQYYETTLITLKTEIDEYNKVKYKHYSPSSIIHSKNKTPLGIAINDIMRKVTKNLIIELNQYCTDFNEKNKDKIDVIYFTDKSVYLAADKGSFNVAFDTLTRVMPLIFNKYIYGNSYCNIEIIE